MSRGKNLFTQVPVQRVPRNLFDLSHEVKMSGKFGYLYPMLCMEAMPGDTIRDQMVAQVRFAPMLAPIMHRVDVKTDFFFVPNRLLSDTWEDFITGGQDGLSEATVPYVTPAGITGVGYEEYAYPGTLWDYLGLPTYDQVGPFTSTERISALPFRAYQQIYNDWFRDPNLDDEIPISPEQNGAVDGSIATIGALRLRGWEKDYFTSALPWAQRGPTVLMPLGGTGSIEWDDTAAGGTWETFAGGLPAAGATSINILRNLTDSAGAGIHPSDSAAQVIIDGASTTINDFRRALALQRWMENNARGGGRYIEQIQAHYNVRVADYRLQRSEYLGGGRQPVIISEVLSTANAGNGPVGGMSGHGISVGKTNRFSYRCSEHGFIIGIISIIPRTAYSQGIPKMWSRFDKYDYAFPELAHLGEQEIASKELFMGFAAANDADNNEVFGYIPRYAEYKFMNDRIAGDFRTTLAYWHLGRMFTARPDLDGNFVRMEGDPANEEAYTRIFAVDDPQQDYFWMQLYHKMTAKRPLPYFGVPQING